MVLSLWFYDDHVGIMEYGLLSTWRDAYGVMWLFIFLSVAFALHLIHALAYGVMSPLASCDHTGTTSFIRHNDVASYLVGYEGRRHGICIAYALFGLWHDGLGLRLWMSLWEAMLLQGLVIINSFHVWGCVNCWIYLIAYCWLTYNWGLNRS